VHFLESEQSFRTATLEANWVFLCFYSVGSLIPIQGLRWFDGEQGFILLYARAPWSESWQKIWRGLSLLYLLIPLELRGRVHFFPLRGVQWDVLAAFGII
jgi:hypothetical protein